MNRLVPNLCGGGSISYAIIYMINHGLQIRNITKLNMGGEMVQQL